MSDVLEAPFLRDPLSPNGIGDLPTFYRELRDHHPAYYFADYDTYFFSRFEHVWELLRTGDNTFPAVETNLPTPEYLRSHHNTGKPPAFASTNPMAAMPALASPWYEEMRNAHMAPLKPKAVAAQAEFIRAERAQGLCEDVNEATRPSADGVVEFASFFVKVKAYIVPCIVARRQAGADGSNGLIDGLVNYRTGEGRALSDNEIADQLVCAMVGGLESASKVTAGGIMELWRTAQVDAVRADLAANVPLAVDEMVRHCAPAQYSFRTAHRDVEIAGARIQAGQRVCAMIWSAAHDEREFERPDEFIWNRKADRVISFGLGQHHCIGKHLALLEVRIMVEEFLIRVPQFHFVMEEAARNPSYFQHGWIRLPVVVGEGRRT